MTLNHEQQAVKLSWNHFTQNLRQCANSMLLMRQDFADITIEAEHKKIKAHRFFLATGSTFFQRFLEDESRGKNDYVYLFGIKYEDIKALLFYMYTGEIVIESSRLPSFLATAAKLGVKGLVEHTDETNDESPTADSTDSNASQSGQTLALDNNSMDASNTANKDGDMETEVDMTEVVQEVAENHDKGNTGDLIEYTFCKYTYKEDEGIPLIKGKKVKLVRPIKDSTVNDVCDKENQMPTEIEQKGNESHGQGQEEMDLEIEVLEEVNKSQAQPELICFEDEDFESEPVDCVEPTRSNESTGDAEKILNDFSQTSTPGGENEEVGTPDLSNQEDKDNNSSIEKFFDPEKPEANRKSLLSDNLKKKKRYSCEICKSDFTEARSLHSHISLKHKIGPAFSCDLCDKTFGRLHSLKRHKKHVHDKVRNHKCDICKKLFFTTSHLVDHMRIHTGVKPYECEICKKTFNQKSILNRHLKSGVVHQKGRKY
eukprot:TRINITY_DN7435_c1_g1_i6.p1 TRINITY_DN7435_c1_g1~~TRINITY_DN7435_c1_g1_i6.p1  ORF type:complete len:485 (+),score=68.38 TRINITY_DN7435_c1_g1_i6:53-1507(+)